MGERRSSVDKNRHTAHISEGEKDQAAQHLNEAIKAVYANTGPSPILVAIRAAMDILDMKETKEARRDTRSCSYGWDAQMRHYQELVAEVGIPETVSITCRKLYLTPPGENKHILRHHVGSWNFAVRRRDEYSPGT